jgi:DNA gyrase subunit A
MPLRRLTALETGKLREEAEELARLIKYLKGLLASPDQRRKLIGEELIALRQKFGDERRTRIVPDEEGDLTIEDLIADEEVVVTVTANGYVKAVNASAYKRQGRGGRGVKGAQVHEDDVITHLVHTTAHAYLLFFTNRGKVYRVKAHEIPRKERTAKGVLVQSVLSMGPDEKVEAVIDTRAYDPSQFLVIVTRQGVVKKTRLSDYESRQQTLIAVRLNEGDEVVAVLTTNGKNDILLFTRAGAGIRFSEEELRAMGRDTTGVRGIRLRPDDAVVSAACDADGDMVLLLTSGGYGKRTKVTEFPRQKRGGFGVKAIKPTRVRGTLVAARGVSAGSEIFVTSSDGVVIRSEADTISRQKRDATGVKVMNLSPGAQITAFALVPPDEAAED